MPKSRVRKQQQAPMQKLEAQLAEKAKQHFAELTARKQAQLAEEKAQTQWQGSSWFNPAAYIRKIGDVTGFRTVEVSDDTFAIKYADSEIQSLLARIEKLGKQLYKINRIGRRPSHREFAEPFYQIKSTIDEVEAKLASLSETIDTDPNAYFSFHMLTRTLSRFSAAVSFVKAFEVRDDLPPPPPKAPAHVKPKKAAPAATTKSKRTPTSNTPKKPRPSRHGGDISVKRLMKAAAFILPAVASAARVEPGMPFSNNTGPGTQTPYDATGTCAALSSYAAAPSGRDVAMRFNGMGILPAGLQPFPVAAQPHWLEPMDVDVAPEQPTRKEQRAVARQAKKAGKKELRALTQANAFQLQGKPTEQSPARKVAGSRRHQRHGKTISTRVAAKQHVKKVAEQRRLEQQRAEVQQRVEQKQRVAQEAAAAAAARSTRTTRDVPEEVLRAQAQRVAAAAKPTVDHSRAVTVSTGQPVSVPNPIPTTVDARTPHEGMPAAQPPKLESSSTNTGQGGDDPVCTFIFTSPAGDRIDIKLPASVDCEATAQRLANQINNTGLPRAGADAVDTNTGAVPNTQSTAVSIDFTPAATGDTHSFQGLMVESDTQIDFVVPPPHSTTTHASTTTQDSDPAVNPIAADLLPADAKKATSARLPLPAAVPVTPPEASMTSPVTIRVNGRSMQGEHLSSRLPYLNPLHSSAPQSDSAVTAPLHGAPSLQGLTGTPPTAPSFPDWITRANRRRTTRQAARAAEEQARAEQEAAQRAAEEAKRVADEQARVEEQARAAQEQARQQAAEEGDELDAVDVTVSRDTNPLPAQQPAGPQPLRLIAPPLTEEERLAAAIRDLRVTRNPLPQQPEPQPRAHQQQPSDNTWGYAGLAAAGVAAAGYGIFRRDQTLRERSRLDQEAKRAQEEEEQQRLLEQQVTPWWEKYKEDLEAPEYFRVSIGGNLLKRVTNTDGSESTVVYNFTDALRRTGEAIPIDFLRNTETKDGENETYMTGHMELTKNRLTFKSKTTGKAENDTNFVLSGVLQTAGLITASITDPEELKQYTITVEAPTELLYATIAKHKDITASIKGAEHLKFKYKDTVTGKILTDDQIKNIKGLTDKPLHTEAEIKNKGPQHAKQMEDQNTNFKNCKDAIGAVIDSVLKKQVGLFKPDAATCSSMTIGETGGAPTPGMMARPVA
ncbi:MAG: hypothetical protein P1U40_06465 [Coxiellaceae bacterium]|nr:hypothetical protein [Coxiellaceae bacterium]